MKSVGERVDEMVTQEVRRETRLLELNAELIADDYGVFLAVTLDIPEPEDSLSGYPSVKHKYVSVRQLLATMVMCNNMHDPQVLVNCIAKFRKELDRLERKHK